MKKLISCLCVAIIVLISAPVMATTVSLDILSDLWPWETSFELILDPGGANTNLPFDLAIPNDPQFADGFVTTGDLTAQSTPYSFSWNVGPGSYEFTIFDSFGDGICCSHGHGSYDLVVDAGLIRTGGEFDYSDTTAFRIDGSVPEPWTMLLLGSGLIGLGVLRKKFKK